MYASYQTRSLSGPLYVNDRLVTGPLTIRHEVSRKPPRRRPRVVPEPPVTDGRADELTHGPYALVGMGNPRIVQKPPQQPGRASARVVQTPSPRPGRASALHGRYVPLPREGKGIGSAGRLDGGMIPFIVLGVGVAYIGGMYFLGRYWGRSMAPERNKDAYGTIGGVSNVVAPLWGPVMLYAVKNQKAKKK